MIHVSTGRLAPKFEFLFIFFYNSRLWTPRWRKFHLNEFAFYSILESIYEIVNAKLLHESNDVASKNRFGSGFRKMESHRLKFCYGKLRDGIDPGYRLSTQRFTITRPYNSTRIGCCHQLNGVEWGAIRNNELSGVRHEWRKFAWNMYRSCCFIMKIGIARNDLIREYLSANEYINH